MWVTTAFVVGVIAGAMFVSYYGVAETKRRLIAVLDWFESFFK